ncbi:MAG TPA: aminoacyl-tRNA hydrolase [Planktothrix sp.]|jgi:PTH1 family peptidyl-tRNA hydrolase
MKILIGLGNPESRYEKTRHNAGFRVIDRLAAMHNVDLRNESKFRALFASATIGGERTLLVKPLTYMNLSGESVQSVLSYFKVESMSDMLVIHDDVSLPLGRIRAQKGGGAGGQHGVESIMRMLSGSKDFHRLKFGVGPDPGGQWRADFVLSQFEPEDVELYEIVIGKSCDAALTWIRAGIQETMNHFNGVVFGLPKCMQEPPDESPPEPPSEPGPADEGPTKP